MGRWRRHGCGETQLRPRAHPVAVLRALSVLLAGAAVRAPRHRHPALRPRQGSPAAAQVLTRRQVDDRTWDLVVDSPAVGMAVDVRLLLPARFDAATAQRWPVLYLLHGCCDSYVGWTRSTDVAALTRPLDLLVAMPEGGDVGFYSDWRSGPAWETFHTAELPALLAARVPGRGPRGDRRPVDGRARRAGLRRPPPRPVRRRRVVQRDRAHPPVARGEPQNYSGSSGPTARTRSRCGATPPPRRRTGSSTTRTTSSPQLRGTPLFVAAGDGRPGPLDPPALAADEIETSIGAQNRALRGATAGGGASTRRSTSTERAPTAGATGSVSCTRPGR